MTGLYIFLGIVGGLALLIAGVLSIPVKVSISYDNIINVKLRWLFVKIGLLPFEDKPKKPKKEKPPKEPAKPKEPQAEQPKAKKPNPLLEMAKANGYDGLMQIIGRFVHYINKFGVAFLRSFKFDNVTLHLEIAKGDAAQTAIEYGKRCEQIYPLFGYIVTHCPVKSYDVNISPDFLANHSDGELFVDMSLCPRKIVNATIAFVARLLFRVGVRFFLNGRSAIKGTSKTEPAKAEPAQNG